jgi:hypothetical protein
MRRFAVNHERWSKFVSVLCVAIVLAMGTAQAAHIHPETAKNPRHICQICSTPSAKLSTANASPVPVMRAVLMTRFETSASSLFRPAIAASVRPPPSA